LIVRCHYQHKLGGKLMLKKSTLLLLALLLVSSVFVPTMFAEEPIRISVLNYFDLTSLLREKTSSWSLSIRRPRPTPQPIDCLT
jgi:hypothetical protein